MIEHIIRWNKWRKNNLNNKFYQFLVLIGIAKSPTMPFILLEEEEIAFAEGFKRGLMKGEKRKK